jgi:hypothetical protein
MSIAQVAMTMPPMIRPSISLLLSCCRDNKVSLDYYITRDAAYTTVVVAIRSVPVAVAIAGPVTVAISVANAVADSEPEAITKD